MRRALLAFLWRRHRLSMGLCLFIPLLVGTGVGLMAPQLQQQREAFASLPFLARFLGSNAASAFSNVTLLSFPFRHPLVLLLYAVFPAIPILALPAGERGRGGLDMLLAAPLDRRALVHALALFVLLAIPVVIAFCFAGSMLAALIAGELERIDVARFALAAPPAGALIATWTGAALIVSVRARNRASATLTYAAFVTTAFLIDSIARIATGVEWMAKFTPYGYYRPDHVILGSAPWIANAVGLATVGVLLTLVAAELQARRTSA